MASSSSSVVGKKPAPPTLDKLLAKWDGFTALYSSNFATLWSLPGVQLLVSNLDWGPLFSNTDRDGSASGNAEEIRIAVVGSGPGDGIRKILLPTLISYATEDSHSSGKNGREGKGQAKRVRKVSILASDWSNGMVKRAEATVGRAVTKANAELKDEGSLTEIALHVDRAPASKLPYPDSSCDRLMTNLCYMLVPDFDAAVKEGSRVLKPGGRIAFTLWGRRSHSHYFGLLDTTLKELDLGATDFGNGFTEPTRSNHHVIDDCKDKTNLRELRERVKAHGFDSVVTFFCNLGKGFLRGRDYALERVGATPSGKSLHKRLSEDEMKRLIDGLAERADALIEEGKPIGLDIVVVLAQKGK